MLLCVVAAALALGWAAPARALITPVTLIDGPSADIVGLGSTAMADDGSGGIVYRKRVGGRVHVFAAQFVGGQWGRAQRVDVGQSFDSGFAVIGAGEGGRLVVAWTNSYSSTTDGLYSASLQPGATGFGAPVPIDLDIGQATAAFPSLAMSRGGQALIAYRVITQTGSAGNSQIPAGYVQSDIRMARYDGQYWSSLGNPVERNPAQPTRAPTAANAPKVAIDLTGEGLVVFQEPDDGFIDRIYARRIFGMVPGNVLQVSPASYAGRPLNAPADEFAVDLGGFGEAAVAYRQQPGNGAAFTRPRVFVNELPNSLDPSAGDFKGARPADGAGADGPSVTPGALTVAVDATGSFDAGFGEGTQTFDAHGTEARFAGLTRLDDGASGVAPDPVFTRADGGAFAAAWKVDVQGSGGVALLERRADGTPNRELVSTDVGGAVRELKLGGSHRGDAVVGFLQGDGPRSQVAALAVRAPPGGFSVAAPVAWVRARRIPIMWETPQAGAGQITYAVLVDDQQVATGLSDTAYALGPDQVGDGVHDVRVEATDAQGQTIDSAPATLMVDRTAPRVRLRVRARTLTVRVSDGPRNAGSGLDASSVKVRFGDGRRGRGRARLRHHFARAGTYTVQVTAADAAGNRRRARRRVRVR